MSTPTINEVVEGVTALRADVAGLAKNALTGEERKRIDAMLDKYDEVTQKTFTEFKRLEGLEAQIEETKGEIEKRIEKEQAYHDRLIVLEALIAQRDLKADGKANYRDLAEYKAIEAWVKRPDGIPGELKAEMRTDVDTAGGFLVPTILDNELLKEIVELDPVRSVSRVKTITSKTLEIVVRTDIPRATYEGEAEENQEDIGAYRLVSVTPYRQTVTVPVTLDQIMNSQWDMNSEIMQDASEGFAEGEGIGFLQGTGVKMPEGITNNPTIVAGIGTAVDAETDDTFAKAIIAMTGELKIGYNPLFALHRRTLARIRALKSSTGEFFWQPGLNGPVQNQILGYPYIVCPSMDPHDTSSGDIMLFGDFRRGYLIVDRVGLSMVRDEVTQARKAIVKLTLHRWNTGIVTMPEAFKMMRKDA